MFCGVPSCVYVEDDDDDLYSRPRSLSLSSSSSSSSKSKRRDKNPYSNRGLDKFATVVADLEAKKEKIIQKMALGEANPDDVVLVRFTHSPSHGGWIPIVIGKKKPQKNAEEDRPKAQDSKQALPPPPAAASAADVTNGKKKVDGRKRRRTWDSCYWAVVLILILVCLVMVGRSFAILCTSIWWYLVPMMSGDGRKEHGTGRMDENLIKKMGGDLKAQHQLKVGSPPRHHLHHHHLHRRK